MKKVFTGFTLVEVIIVVIIIAILSAIIIPSIKNKEKEQLEIDSSLSFNGKIIPQIPLKSPLNIVAAGSTDMFTVYKVHDEDESRTFYVIVSSNENQKLQLERYE